MSQLETPETSESDALSNCATGAYLYDLIIITAFPMFVKQKFFKKSKKDC